MASGLLVNYSGSSSEDDSEGETNENEEVNTEKRSAEEDQQEEGPAKKAKKNILPSVPGDILNMFDSGDSDGPGDNPSQHGGRVRSFKHERGNWATYVYIPVRYPDLYLDLADELMEMLKDLNFTPVDHFHLSVSRTVVIRHHWIDSLMDSLREKYCLLPHFSCRLGSLKLYCNDEKTRTFLSLQVEDTQTNQLKELVEKTDDCLTQFKLPKFYDNPSFHISLLASVGDLTDKVSPELMQELQDEVSNFWTDNSQASFFSVPELQCKTGNKLYKFPLKSYPGAP